MKFSVTAYFMTTDCANITKIIVSHSRSNAVTLFHIAMRADGYDVADYITSPATKA